MEELNKRGEKISLFVNGCLVFDNDVTAEDTECIASLSYNGKVLLPGQARAALASKVKIGNGFMGEPKMKTEEEPDKKDGDTSINMGTYILA
jgi:hypothetical protein